MGECEFAWILVETDSTSSHMYPAVNFVTAFVSCAKFKCKICLHNLADLNENGKKFVVSRGGSGGGPDNGYSSKKVEPRSLRIDLKLLADVGLVG